MIWVLHTFSRFLAALPFRAALGVGGSLGWFLGTVIRHRRRDAAEALARSLPELSDAERKRILQQMYRHLGKTVAEQLRISINGLDEFAERINIIGEEQLPIISAQDSGILLLMAHFGNWELGALGNRLVDRPLNVVVKPMRDPKFDQYLTRTRRKMNVNLLPVTSSFRECIKVLKRKEFLGMILDQNTRIHRGVFVEFFGRPACTTNGLAILSAQTKSPVLPISVIRRDDGRYDFTVQELLPPPENREPETLREATQLYTRIIEDMIREHPEQWIWIHRRWRTQPPPGDA